MCMRACAACRNVRYENGVENYFGVDLRGVVAPTGNVISLWNAQFLSHFVSRVKFHVKCEISHRYIGCEISHVNCEISHMNFTVNFTTRHWKFHNSYRWLKSWGPFRCPNHLHDTLLFAARRGGACGRQRATARAICLATRRPLRRRPALRRTRLRAPNGALQTVFVCLC